MGLESLLERLEARSGTSGTCDQTAAVPTETASQLAWTPGTFGTSEKIEGKAENIPAALARPDLPPLSRASEARRRKVFDMLTRDAVQYAVLVEDADTDPVVMAVATPDGTREVLIPRDQYDPFEALMRVHRWDTGIRDGAKSDPASGGITITEAELEAARKGRIVVPGGEP